MAIKFDRMLAKLRESDEGVAANGLPAGGSEGQILYKLSGDDNDAGWKDEAAGVTSRFLCVWFEAVAEGAGGTLAAPTGGTLVADQWPDGVDALATRLDAAGRPTWETPRTAAGSLVTAALDVGTGAWELSGTPDDYPVGIVFAYTVSVGDYDPDYALVGPDYQGDEPMTEISVPADTDKAVFWQGGVLKFRLWSGIASYMAGLITTHETSHAPADAEANVNADWEAESGDALILNKPTLGTAAALNAPASGDAAAGEVVKGSDTRLTNARTPAAHAGGHTDGTDDIQSATNAQKGLATAAQITALEAATAAQHTQGTDQKLDNGGANEVTAPQLKTLVSAYVKNKLDATEAPDGDNDEDEGYAIGSLWLDTVAKKLYVCMDPSDGAADWDELTGGDAGGGIGGATGSVDNAVLRADGTGGATAQASNVAIADYEAATQANVGLSVIHDTESNVALRLQPKGTGALLLGPAPDGTTTGGNTRGDRALDLQLSRTTADRVASGADSVAIGKSNRTTGANTVGIGNANTVSNGRAFGDTHTVSGTSASAIGGDNSSATDHRAVTIGSYATAAAYFGVAINRASKAYLSHQLAIGSGFGSNGSVQTFILGMYVATSATDLANLVIDEYASRAVLPAGQTWLAWVLLQGRQDDGSSGRAVRLVQIKREGTTTALVGSVQTIGTDHWEANLGTPTITAAADDTNEALQIAVTPANATATRWFATLFVTELGY